MNSKTVPLSVRRLQTCRNLQCSRGFGLLVWRMKPRETTMEPKPSQGFMKMERLLKNVCSKFSNAFLRRELERSWMHIGELITALPHIFRPSRSSQMEAMTHQRTIHKFLMSCNPRSTYALYRMLLSFKISMVRAGNLKWMRLDVEIETTVQRWYRRTPDTASHQRRDRKRTIFTIYLKCYIVETRRQHAEMGRERARIFSGKRLALRLGKGSSRSASLVARSCWPFSDRGKFAEENNKKYNR